MIIVVNGGYRTGSTLSYNIAGCIEEKNQTGVRIGGRDKEDIDDLIQNNVNFNSVVKCHNWFPDQKHIHNNVKVLYTYRYDIRDCIASYILINNDNVNLHHIIKMAEEQMYYVQYMKKINHPNVLVIEYSEFYNNTLYLTHKIHDFLESSLSDIDLYQISKEWSIDAVRDRIKDMTISADPISELRQNHISDFNGANGYWEKVISKDILSKINEIIKYYDK